MKQIWITGGAWITAAGVGTLSGGERIVLAPGRPQIPPAREIFSERIARYGRYDELTKLGCACVALALRDADILWHGRLARDSDHGRDARATGIVSSSALECLETDLAYYRTTLDEGGALASPNLFSYTLPGIMQGECAVNFGLTGPTICVGEEGGRGMAALRQAAALIQAGAAPAMLAGWIDAFTDETQAQRLAPDFTSGAAFIVLEAGVEAEERKKCELGDLNNIQSILDFFMK